jgi:hypothetical protein
MAADIEGYRCVIDSRNSIVWSSHGTHTACFPVSLDRAAFRDTYTLFGLLGSGGAMMAF